MERSNRWMTERVRRTRISYIMDDERREEKEAQEWKMTKTGGGGGGRGEKRQAIIHR